MSKLSEDLTAAAQQLQTALEAEITDGSPAEIHWTGQAAGRGSTLWFQFMCDGTALWFDGSTDYGSLRAEVAL